jgi:hypothetical protein
MPGSATETIACNSNRSSRRLARLLASHAAFLCLLALFSPRPAYSQDSLRIDSIGLGNYYSYSGPTLVRVHVPATPRAQTIQLEFIVRSGNNDRHREINRTDRFVERFEAAPGQPLEIAAPILISQAAWHVLTVSAYAADGQMIGRLNRDLKDLAFLENSQYLVAIYCTNNAACRAVQSQIAFGEGGEASSQKNRNLRMITFSEARPAWWAYSPAATVVLAGPISGFSTSEREALENFTRGGGVLTLLEEEAADKAFLAAYRQGPANAAPIPVGRGHLVRIQSTASNQLVPSIIVWTGYSVGREAPRLPLDFSSDPLLNRIGVSFTFPQLRWLLIWLTIYLLAVGPFNFAILRRLKRLEWGWASVCLLAVLFTAGFYLSSSSRRPRNYTLDNATVYSLDDRSPVAVEHIGLRVSAPGRGDVQLSVNDGAIVVPSVRGPELGSDSTGVEIGADMTDKAHVQQGWDLELGPRTIVRAPMLRWSFQDWGFEGFRKFAGTVHWTSTTKLKNDTGVTFREAMYFDFNANKEYPLSQVAAGEEIDLTSRISSEIWARETLPNNVTADVLVNRQSRGTGGFSIAEAPSWSLYVPKAGQVFAGVSDQPISTAELQPLAVNRSAMAVTIVYLSEK